MFVTGPDVHQDRDPRGGEQGGPRRRHDPQRALGRRPLRGRRRPGLSGPHPRAPFLPAPEQPRGGSLPEDRRPPRARGAGPRRPRPRGSREALRHEGAHRGGGRRPPLPRGARPLRPEHRGRLRPLRGTKRGDRGQPARGPRRLPGHRRLRQGRPLRALLRRLQHPPRHLRGRAGLPARHRRRSSAGSSATAPSCSTPTPKPPSPRSRSSPGRPTAGPTA